VRVKDSQQLSSDVIRRVSEEFGRIAEQIEICERSISAVVHALDRLLELLCDDALAHHKLL